MSGGADDDNISGGTDEDVIMGTDDGGVLAQVLMITMVFF